jgi:D-proline reductase (dithiol) PrdB
VGDLSEFSLAVRTFLRAYRWRRIDPLPWTVPSKPLAASRLALVSSAGFVLPDQQPFDEAIRGGDPSFREIPADVDPAVLRDTHRSGSFDHTGMCADPNLAFPVERVRELAADHRIGSVAASHVSFMGSILAPGRFVRDSVPRIADLLVADAVDVALLVPV